MTSYFEDLASEENPSELTSYADQSLDIDETFQVGFRYNLVNEKRIVESRHTPDQHVFKVSIGRVTRSEQSARNQGTRRPPQGAEAAHGRRDHGRAHEEQRKTAQKQA